MSLRTASAYDHEDEQRDDDDHERPRADRVLRPLRGPERRPLGIGLVDALGRRADPVVVVMHLVCPPAPPALPVTLGVGAEGDELQAVAPALPGAHDGRRAVDDGPGADVDDLVLELEATRSGEDDVDLLAGAVAAAEADALTRGQAGVGHADALGSEVLAVEAGLARLGHAVLRRHVLGVVEAHRLVLSGHATEATRVAQCARVPVAALDSVLERLAAAAAPAQQARERRETRKRIRVWG